MSVNGLKTASGKAIKAPVVQGIVKQVGQYDRALRLLDEVEEEVEEISDSTPPRGAVDGGVRKAQASRPDQET